MNSTIQHKEKLGKRNYILKNGVGWIGLAKSKIDSLFSLFGPDFNLILYNNELRQADYYIIPYSYIKDMTISENLSVSKAGRLRWIAWVKDQKLKIGKSGKWHDISKFYGVPISEFIIAGSSNNLINYTGINIRREISVRKDQSLFRSAVLSNFGHTCCLTGATENHLLEASHIKSWSEDETMRLDPGNGLCLTVAYHKLFDKGYFTFDQKYNVIVTERIDTLSEETRRQLQAIRGKRIRKPERYDLRLDALKYHRKTVFNKFE